MYFKISCLIFILFFSGCKKKEEIAYFPLAKGNKWIYTVRSGLQIRVDTLKVIRETSIDGTKGWTLLGPCGLSTLYWLDGILKIKSIPSLQIYPSLPLLDTSQKTNQIQWKGTIVFEGKNFPAIAKLKQSTDKYQEGGKIFDCLKSDLVIQFDNKTTELITWFHKGTGIICQQQRTNNYLDISMEYLTGP